MAGYDIFSQMQGPAVPINLFADNATAGINAGNALPTPLTAGIQGAIKGIETGQRIVSNQQNIALKQNEIDQLPVTNAQQQEQLTNAQNINKINALKLDIAETTHSLEIDAETANLENQASKLKQEKNLRDKEQQFVTSFSSASPQQQAQMLLSGQYADLFNANPRLYQQQLNSVVTNPNNGLPEAQRAQLARVAKAVGASEYWDRMATQNDQALEAAKGALYGEDWVTSAAEQIGSTPEEVPDKVEFIPHGKYKTTPSGMLIPNTIAGGWQTTEGYDPAAYKGQFDLIDKETGQVLDGTGALTDKNKQVYSTFLQKKRIADGTYKRDSVNSILEEPKKQPQSKQQGPATFADPKAAQNPQPTDTFSGKVAQSLNLPEAMLAPAAPELDRLEHQLTMYALAPNTRGRPQNIKDYNDTLDSIARSITDKQFDDSPAIQAQYTQSHVDAYNRALINDVTNIDPSQVSIFNIHGPITGETPKVVQAYQVTSPKDLYYVRQRPLITSRLDSMADSILGTTEAEAPANAGARQQRASQSTIDFLSGVARGGAVNSQ